ncbi:hypothetical protein ScPMuIL_017424 [Solemya velum]
MATSRSSVRTESTKMPWGTILKPTFGLGHQKMSEDVIEEAVTRLNKVKPLREREYPRPGIQLDREQTQEMLIRLTKVKRVPDSDRRVKSSIYNPMGVVRSYAWQGL